MNTKPTVKYAPGTQYMSRGKHKKLCTVTDALFTYNLSGDLVRVRYISTHEFLGQTVRDTDVCAATIAMGLQEPQTA